MSNRSVGALAPLCFLFSVFQHARPPATPRRLRPPLTEKSKPDGPALDEIVAYMHVHVRVHVALYLGAPAGACA